MTTAAVMDAAGELFAACNYLSVVALATRVLENDATDNDIRFLRARAFAALRRDQEAQSDLSECLKRQPRCARAYRLLGEVCVRQGEFGSARVFLKEALRLEPADDHARDVLGAVNGFLQSTAVVEKLPAAAAAVDCPSYSESRVANRPPRLACGTSTPATRAHAQGDEYYDDLSAPTVVHAWPVSRNGIVPFAETETNASITLADPPDLSAHNALTVGVDAFGKADCQLTVPGRRRALGSEHDGEAIPEMLPEPADFGIYLLRIGELTPNQLHVALDYQRRKGLGLAAIIVRLGYCSEATMRTAGRAFRAEQAQ